MACGVAIRPFGHRASLPLGWYAQSYWQYARFGLATPSVRRGTGAERQKDGK